MTGKPDGQVRALRLAAVEAGHSADPAAGAALTTALEHPEHEVRASALAALERRGEVSSEVLERGLADEHPAVRGRALTVAARSWSAELRPNIVALVADQDDRVAELAATTLGEDPAPTPAVMSALIWAASEHHDPLVRESAVAALGSLAVPEGLPAVLAACTDKPAIRRRAVLALSTFDDEAAGDAIERALEDNDRHVRALAAELLGRPVS